MRQDKDIHVYILETRPYLQGARLTAYECMEEGIPLYVNHRWNGGRPVEKWYSLPSQVATGNKIGTTKLP